jgi:hypothetical protein
MVLKLIDFAELVDRGAVSSIAFGRPDSLLIGPKFYESYSNMLIKLSVPSN